ncbi:MAG TPA: TatD family hydrolase [Trueperaceae bacterium]|nr:TatD family hydrolase [Trueperaceae bacterium]
MIDTHCHLTRIDVPVAHATAGLAAVVTVGTGVADCLATVALATKEPAVWAAVGIHPNDASAAAAPEARAAIEELAGEARVVAIGETGFDTHWDRETLQSQTAAFEWHAELAAALGKPLVLHVRDAPGTDGASRAAERAIHMAGHPHGVLHCCNGDERLLAAALELGWYASFAGNLTYKTATAIQRAAAGAPLERLLVETDSPYLAPVPHRGKPNVPTHVRFTASRLAALRDLEEDVLERQLDENANRLFNLRGSA